MSINKSKTESPKTPRNDDRVLRKPNLKDLRFFFAPNINPSHSSKLRHFLYKCGSTVEEFLDRTINVVVVESIKPGEPSSSTPTPEIPTRRRVLEKHAGKSGLTEKNAEQQSSRVTTTPKQQSSRVTTTPKQQSSRVTTTPKQQSSRVTTTPKQQSSRVTTTPKQQSSRVTTTPKQQSSRVTTTPKQQPGRATTTPKQHQACRSWLKQSHGSEIKARATERPSPQNLVQQSSTPKAATIALYETAFNKTMETAKKLGIRVVNIKTVLTWLPSSFFKPQTSTSGKKETNEKIPMQKPCLKLDDGIRKPVFEQSLDLPTFNFTRSSKKRENSSTTTTGMTYTIKTTTTNSCIDDNEKKSGDGIKKSEKQQRKKAQQQQRRGYCERCEKSYLSESKHLKSEEHCRFDETEGNFDELKQYIEENALGMDVLFAKYGQKLEINHLQAADNNGGGNGDYENIESPPFTKSDIRLLSPPPALPLTSQRDDDLLCSNLNSPEELMTSEVLFPALSPLADGNSQL